MDRDTHLIWEANMGDDDRPVQWTDEFTIQTAQSLFNAMPTGDMPDDVIERYVNDYADRAQHFPGMEGQRLGANLRQEIINAIHQLRGY